MSQAVANPRALPKKEAEMLRSVMQCYETKQYKKGWKLADNILRKFPNHGETQAMKGIIANALNKKDEAYELVKAGLRNDVKSHICWHVYGLLYRSDNNYKEAIKCYLNALRIDPNNQNILRDLSFLQIQMRDYPGFLSTRRKILEGKPTVRLYWVAYAAAQYVNHNYLVANDVVAKFLESTSEKGEAYEDSELLLFQNLCFEKAGQYHEALQHLQGVQSKIVDKLSYHMKYAQLLTLTAQFDAAQREWEMLLQWQPENYRFHAGLQAALAELSAEQCLQAFALKRLALPCGSLPLSSEQKDKLLAYYSATSLSGAAVRKIRLALLSGRDNFPDALTAHLQRALDAELPSLFQDVAALIRDYTQLAPSSADVVVDLRRHPVWQIAKHVAEDVVATGAENPAATLWALLLLAHLHELSGEYDVALQTIEQSLAHTPTAIDMLVKRARLHKKLGDVAAAAQLMDECRDLDLQDRYLNNKATKYLLRNNQVDQAMGTIAMFTKHEGDVQRNLYDLQCNWFILELAEAHAREKQWGLALKNFAAVRKNFLDQYDDLFDFHAYCFRKTSLRAYMDMLSTQDVSFAHKYFQRAYRGAMKIFLHLLDCPEDIDGLGHLPPAERKKERAKLKKKKQRDLEKQQQMEKQQADEASAAGVDGKVAENSHSKSESDATGDAYLQKDFLQEAGAWSELLHQRLSLCSPATIAMYAEVMFRRSKYLCAARALYVGLSQDKVQADLSVFLLRVAMKLRAGNVKKVNNNSAVALQQLRTTVQELIGGDSLAHITAYVEGLAQAARQQQSLALCLAAIKCQFAVDKSQLNKWESLLAESCWWEKGKELELALVHDAVKFVEQNCQEMDTAAQFISCAKAQFPRAKSFRDALDSPPAAPEASREEA